jgi:hypothetical protein
MQSFAIAKLRQNSRLESGSADFFRNADAHVRAAVPETENGLSGPPDSNCVKKMALSNAAFGFLLVDHRHPDRRSLPTLQAPRVPENNVRFRATMIFRGMTGVGRKTVEFWLVNEGRLTMVALAIANFPHRPTNQPYQHC